MRQGEALARQRGVLVECDLGEEFPPDQNAAEPCALKIQKPHGHIQLLSGFKGVKGRSKSMLPPDFVYPAVELGFGGIAFYGRSFLSLNFFSLSLISRAMPSRRSTSCWVKSRALAPWARRK